MVRSEAGEVEVVRSRPTTTDSRSEVEEVASESRPSELVKLRTAEMTPSTLMTMSAGTNIALGLARRDSKAPLMISPMLKGRSGMIPGLGARKKPPGTPEEPGAP